MPSELLPEAVGPSTTTNFMLVSFIKAAVSYLLTTCDKQRGNPASHHNAKEREEIQRETDRQEKSQDTAEHNQRHHYRPARASQCPAHDVDDPVAYLCVDAEDTSKGGHQQHHKELRRGCVRVKQELPGQFAEA